MKIKGTYIAGLVTIDDKYLSPAKSQKAYNHSPDGFSWGYGGSGPSQLALALLLEVTNKETALKYYQDFKGEIIATLPQTDFEIELDIKEWLKKKKLKGSVFEEMDELCEGFKRDSDNFIKKLKERKEVKNG